MAAQKLKMDLTDTHILYLHLLQYKNEESLFNQAYTEIDHPIKWWSNLELNPSHLQKLAIHLFSICPNSVAVNANFLLMIGFQTKGILNLV